MKRRKTAISEVEYAIIREGFGRGKGLACAGGAPSSLVLHVTQGTPSARVPRKGVGGKGKPSVGTKDFFWRAVTRQPPGSTGAAGYPQ